GLLDFLDHADEGLIDNGCGAARLADHCVAFETCHDVCLLGKAGMIADGSWGFKGRMRDGRAASHQTFAPVECRYSPIKSPKFPSFSLIVSRSFDELVIR